MMNKLANDIASAVMYKLAALAGDYGYMEKDAAAAINGISRGLGGHAFRRALVNGLSNRNGLVFERLGYSMPNGSGVLGGTPFLVKGSNKPFLLDAPITERVQPVNRMFDADNLINWNLF